ncbi:hypothetical protein KTH_41470 [Thermosporothrix hazakensis]|nr:hypothetical protein KTH_41470 [Thermosporothrix hazakensis]
MCSMTWTTPFQGHMVQKGRPVEERTGSAFYGPKIAKISPVFGEEVNLTISGKRAKFRAF